MGGRLHTASKRHQQISGKIRNNPKALNPSSDYLPYNLKSFFGLLVRVKKDPKTVKDPTAITYGARPGRFSLMVPGVARGPATTTQRAQYTLVKEYALDSRGLHVMI